MFELEEGSLYPSETWKGVPGTVGDWLLVFSLGVVCLRPESGRSPGEKCKEDSCYGRINSVVGGDCSGLMPLVRQEWTCKNVDQLNSQLGWRDSQYWACGWLSSLRSEMGNVGE